MEKLSSTISREHAFLPTTVAEDENWLVSDVRIKLGKNQEKESYEEEKKEYEVCMNVKSNKAMTEDEVECREAFMTRILAEYMESMSSKSKFQIGYPLVCYSDYYDGLAPFLRFHINNAGDPFISGNLAIHSRKFEVEVLDWFAILWELVDTDDEYWGYITNGGTEGNFHGLLLGRERFPGGILYASAESHYSIFKAAKILRIECVVVGTSVTGKMDLADLNAKLLLHNDKPAIVNVNIGTTFKGALDDLDLIVETLYKCSFADDRFYIHCDGALSGIMVPFLHNATKLSFKKLPIGSISVSGHKFLGCPMPCGVQMTRKKYITNFATNVEYLNTVDATISGSRNGHSPIFLWYILNRKGYSGIKNDVTKCIANAHYLTNKLKKAGISSMLNESSITVVFERPNDPEFVAKWQLACFKNMAHVVTLPNITIEVIDKFCDELVQNRLIWYRNKMFTPPCVAMDMGDNNCCCLYHKGKSLKF